MFKKLFLVLILSLALVLPVVAAELGQECVMAQGTKAFQITDNGPRGVIVPEDTLVTVMDHITPELAQTLNEITATIGMVWDGAHIVTFKFDFQNGAPPQDLFLVLRVEDLICN